MKLSFRAKIILPLVAVFAILLAFTPRTAKWSYVYQKGSPWMYDTFRAALDFPILKTQEQIAEESAELSQTTVPYFTVSSSIAIESLSKVSNLDFGAFQSLRPAVVSALGSIYDKGVVSDAALQSIPSSGVIYVLKDKRSSELPVSEVYGLTQARAALLADVSRAVDGRVADSLFRAAGVFAAVVPNLVLDEQITSAMNGRKSVSPTIGSRKAGDILINKGDIVTDELAQVLDSYKAEYESKARNSWSWKSWLGSALLSLAMTVCLFFAIYFSSRGILKIYNKYLYLLTIFTLLAVLEMLVIHHAPAWLLIVPVPVFALYLNAFFRTKLIFPLYLVSLFPILLYAQNGAALFMLYAVSGTVTIYVFRHFSKGVKQFVVAMITFGVDIAVYFGLALSGLLSLSLPQDPIMLFAASLLQVAAYPFVYLAERAFNLVSNSRLEELSESSNKLLRDLEQKAPGTFQHSLQVSAMAQSVARAIGADEYLLKAGAMYHDIGKMNNPLCFVENESLITADAGKYHDGLTPLQSAQDIIRHVTDGMQLAAEHRLPSVVSDFIITHHGTSCVAYFYDKYLKEGGDPSHKAEFCYPGRKPQTREQAVLMICDSLEAASRTLKDYSPDTVAAFVDRMIEGKIEDGQLSESEISMHDLALTAQVIRNYIAQTHHERIKYPKRKL